MVGRGLEPAAALCRARVGSGRSRRLTDWVGYVKRGSDWFEWTGILLQAGAGGIVPAGVRVGARPCSQVQVLARV